MCHIEKVTYVDPDGHHTVKRYARLCEKATANHTCPDVTHTDRGEEPIANMPSSRTRSSHGSSSSNTLADTASSPASRPSSSVRPAKPWTEVTRDAIRVHRPKASSSDAGDSSSLKRLDPAIRKREVVLNQGGTSAPPTSAGPSRRADGRRESQSSSTRPLSGYSTRSYSPTFSVSSSEPVYELRSPAIATDARSTGSRFSSRTSSGADKPPRPGQTRYRRHVSDDSIEESAQESAPAGSSFNTVVPDQPDTVTDIDDTVDSDIEAGLAKARHRDQMREQQSRRHQDEMRDYRIETLEEQLSALKTERERLSGESDRPRQDDSSSSRASADRGTQRLRRTSTFSRQSDSKGKARAEDHLASDGSVISGQSSRRRSGTEGLDSSSSRSTASTIKGNRGRVDSEPDKGEPVPRPSQESGDSNRRRHKHTRHKGYRS